MLELIAQADPMSLPLWAVLAFSAAMYPLGFMLGAPCSACCGDEECNRCINIVYQGSPGYKWPNCEPTDEYECDITIPDEYSLPVKIKITGGVDDDLKVNGTLIEDGLYPFLDDCNGAHSVGTYDDGDGYVTTVNNRTVTLTLVDNFGGYTAMNLTVCIDPDNEQNLCLPPTTTCEQPPPVESPCCRRLFVLEECDDLAVFVCDEYATEAQCCASTEEDPSVCAENPPVTSCEPTGIVPRAFGPFDCYNDLQRNGAFVSVSGYLVWRGDRSLLDPCLVELYELFELLMNDTWFLPFPCFGVVSDYEITSGSADLCGTTTGYNIYISLNLCDKSVSVRVLIQNCCQESLSFTGDALEKVAVPCNTFSACACESYGGEVVAADEDFPATVMNVLVA